MAVGGAMRDRNRHAVRRAAARIDESTVACGLPCEFVTARHHRGVDYLARNERGNVGSKLCKVLSASARWIALHRAVDESLRYRAVHDPRCGPPYQYVGIISAIAALE